MNSKIACEKLLTTAKVLFIKESTTLSELEKKWEGPLRRYAELLASCSSARLTGSRDAGELYAFHVRDCLCSVPLLPTSGSVIDVGSGGGLPGLVWAICRPDLSVALLDSARKKCRALEGFRDALGLTNVFVTWTRCEEHALTARETYALAAARALAHVGVLAEYLSPLTVHGGRLLAFKGPKGPAELVQVGDQWDKLGLSRPYVLPYDPMARAGAELERRDYSFIIWEKNAPCSSLYPRKPGLALSKNWWHQEQAH